MSEPTTNFRGLIVPNTGDLSGTWGSAAINPNLSAIDGMFAGFATISLTNSPVTLSVPSGYTPTPGAGPTQSQNSLIRFTGALTGNCVITFPLPGYYIVENLCTVTGTYYVQLTNGSGNTIGAPPGKKCHVFNDGTNMDYVNMPDPGTAYDLHGATALPPWMNACTVLPYLIKDGTVYNYSAYPNLGPLLGATFGGNGSTTFGVPDERARARIGYDTGATNRLTTAISGVNGATMASAGGDQRMQQHNHGINDPGHNHSTTADPVINYLVPNSGGERSPQNNGGAVTGTSTTGITINNAGAGASQNVQPSIISFLPLIKT